MMSSGLFLVFLTAIPIAANAANRVIFMHQNPSTIFLHFLTFTY